MVWPATDRLLVAALVATPLLRLTGFPKFMPSIWNCTVPVGVPAPWAAATVAVKLMLWPSTLGLIEETTAVVLLPLFTVCVKTVELLAAKLPSPLYLATI